MMENGKNGNVKWWQLVTAFIMLLGIFVSVALAFGGYSIRSDSRIEAGVERNNDRFHSIDVRLSRIEERLITIDKKL